MNRLTGITTAIVATVALSIGIAACQPQGEPAMTGAKVDDADMPEAQDMTDTEPKALTAAEMSALLVGNTIIGSFPAWKLTWSEYFAPDGTAMAWLKFEDQDDMRITGKHYTNSRGQFCTEYPETPDQQVYCNLIVPLGDGRYQQLYPDGTRGAIYNQILPGEQINALE